MADPIVAPPRARLTPVGLAAIGAVVGGLATLLVAHEDLAPSLRIWGVLDGALVAWIVDRCYAMRPDDRLYRLAFAGAPRGLAAVCLALLAGILGFLVLILVMSGGHLGNVGPAFAFVDGGLWGVVVGAILVVTRRLAR